MQQSIKQCRRCEQVLPISAFKKDGRYAGGISSYCKGCESEAVRRSQAKKRGGEYKPLPARGSLEAKCGPELWAWLEKRLPQGMPRALSLVWEADLVAEATAEVARLDDAAEELAMASETCSECGLSACTCSSADTSTSFTTLEELPGLPI